MSHAATSSADARTVHWAMPIVRPVALSCLVCASTTICMDFTSFGVPEAWANASNRPAPAAIVASSASE
jgi:hypothetical protein